MHLLYTLLLNDVFNHCESFLLKEEVANDSCEERFETARGNRPKVKRCSFFFLLWVKNHNAGAVFIP